VAYLLTGIGFIWLRMGRYSN